MSHYYEVPFETSSTFSTEFPPSLSKVLDQLTFIQSIESLNRAILDVPYNSSIKGGILLSLFVSCYFTFDPAFSPYSFEYSVIGLLIAPILYLIGNVYQSYERRKPLQIALESINHTINAAPNQSIPVSFRLYNPPLKQDRVKAGVHLTDNSVDSYSDVVHIGNVSLFAGRSLYVEVGYPVNPTVEPALKPGAVVAVDIPINLSILGSCFGCDYDAIFPAPIAHLVDQQTFTDIIQRINAAMHAVTINRFIMAIAVIMVVASLPMLYDLRVDRYSPIAMIGVGLLASGTLLVCGCCLSHMSHIVDAAKQAVQSMNEELASKTPRMKLVPLGEPPYTGGLHGSNMHFDYAFKASELMLVVGQPVDQDSRLIDIQ